MGGGAGVPLGAQKVKRIFFNFFNFFASDAFFYVFRPRKKVQIDTKNASLGHGSSSLSQLGVRGRKRTKTS
jgi:hypothetical protein